MDKSRSTHKLLIQRKIGHEIVYPCAVVEPRIALTRATVQGTLIELRASPERHDR